MATKEVQFKSTHSLDFMGTPWHRDPTMMAFRVGTCHGLYYPTEKEYVILAIENNEPGNGHFEDVLEWFENSCRRDKKNLGFNQVMNKRLMAHLVTKRGFRQVTDLVAIKERI